MAKLFSPRVGQNFGEAFLSTLDRERKLNQQQQQFQQQMAFRNRQLNFINIYRDNLIEQNRVQEERLRDQGIADVIGGGFTPIDQVEGDVTRVPTTELFGQEFLNPQTQAPKQEGIERTITKNINGKPIIFGVTDSGELIELGEKFIKPDKSDKSKDPQPQKWRNFGESIGELKKFEKGSDDFNSARTSARQSAYATMLPNAWSFYKKYFKDSGREGSTNKFFLARIRWGLKEDLINAEDAQDLIDFSKYRSDLFELGAPTTKPDDTNFLGF